MPTLTLSPPRSACLSGSTSRSAINRSYCPSRKPRAALPTSIRPVNVAVRRLPARRPGSGASCRCGRLPAFPAGQDRSPDPWRLSSLPSRVPRRQPSLPNVDAARDPRPSAPTRRLPAIREAATTETCRPHPLVLARASVAGLAGCTRHRSAENGHRLGNAGGFAITGPVSAAPGSPDGRRWPGKCAFSSGGCRRPTRCGEHPESSVNSPRSAST